MTKYTIELEVGYHGDDPHVFYRRRVEATTEEVAYATMLCTLAYHNIPMWRPDSEGVVQPIHSVKVAYVAPSRFDEDYLKEYGRAEEDEFSDK